MSALMVSMYPPDDVILMVFSLLILLVIGIGWTLIAYEALTKFPGTKEEIPIITEVDESDFLVDGMILYDEKGEIVIYANGKWVPLAVA